MQRWSRQSRKVSATGRSGSGIQPGQRTVSELDVLSELQPAPRGDRQPHLPAAVQSRVNVAGTGWASEQEAQEQQTPRCPRQPTQGPDEPAGEDCPIPVGPPSITRCAQSSGSSTSVHHGVPFPTRSCSLAAVSARAEGMAQSWSSPNLLMGRVGSRIGELGMWIFFHHKGWWSRNSDRIARHARQPGHAERSRWRPSGGSAARSRRPALGRDRAECGFPSGCGDAPGDIQQPGRLGMIRL